ncbi:MAG TPA: glycosyltransferase, partial [Ktedonobacteraceae bacterium]
SKRLQERMVQARRWGRIVQQIRFLEHVPTYTINPTVLFVHARELDAATHLQLQALQTQRVHCQSSGPHISLFWLWRHRAQQGQAYAIVHFHHPGLFITNYWHYQRYWFLLRLIQQLGLRVVMTDIGGWWYSERHLRFLPQRTFEHMLCYRSDLVITHVRHPDQFYADKTLHRRISSLPHPGFHGYYLPGLKRAEARHLLGLPTDTSFVYLCLASYHTEREILQLIDAYTAIPSLSHLSLPDAHVPQLLLIGMPRDKKQPQLFWQRAALHSTIHLCMQAHEDELALYLEAVDAVVLPHFAVPAAGILEEALLALSYKRCVIAPKLPRFTDILSETCSILYDPVSCANLTAAMIRATSQSCQLQLHDLRALEASSGWQAYARRLHQLYKGLLIRPQQS